jgi:hypothetical protein
MTRWLHVELCCARVVSGMSMCYHTANCRRELNFCSISRTLSKETFRGGKVSEKVGPTQRILTKVNHKVTQRTKLIRDLPQTRCVLRCRVKSSCSETGDMCVCSVLSTDLYFQVRKACRRYTRLLAEALVNQLLLRLIILPDYPQPPKRGTPATMQFTRMTLIRPSCSSHRLEVGYFDTCYLSFVRARSGERPIAPRDDQLFLSSGWSPSTCCD